MAVQRQPEAPAVPHLAVLRRAHAAADDASTNAKLAAIVVAVAAAVAAVVAAALALSPKLSFELIAKQSEASAPRDSMRVALDSLLVSLAARRLALSQHMRRNVPDAIDAFTAIGRGVGLASQDYAQLAAAAAVSYYQRALAVAVQLRPRSKAMALRREGKAAIERREVMAAALKLARLKLACEAVVARREAVSEAFDAKWKVVLLKREEEVEAAPEEDAAAPAAQPADVTPARAAEMAPPDGFEWGAAV